MIEPLKWMTNDPEAAQALRRADSEYANAREKAKNLPLAEKIIALRDAKEKLHAAYNRVREG